MNTDTKISELAVNYYLLDKERRWAQYNRKLALQQNPCIEARDIGRCFANPDSREWCKNCQATRLYHDFYIVKAEQTAAARNKLNHLLKKVTA